MSKAQRQEITFREASIAGMNSMSLLALEASPYKSFYEKMGGRVVGRKTVDMAGVEFTALVYGWDSLAES